MDNRDKTVEYIEAFLNEDYANLKKSLEKLLKNYKKKEHRLETIIKQSDRQQTRLLELNRELDKYKNYLEERVEEEIALRQDKERMLLQQSKLAAMGEMMDAVAHQWKQPLNVIGMQAEILEYDYEDDLMDKEYIQNFRNQIFAQIEHMTDTLNEFRTFFRPNKNEEEFNVKEMIDKVLLLVKDEFMKHQITIKLNNIQDFTIFGIENEFKHLILNIINNAKDAFNDNDIKSREILINISHDNKSIEIIDNAGGIPENIINDIFKANVTSKAEDKGTGIGLYMSSQIAQKHNGELSVENVSGGAKFTFKQIF